VLSQTPTAIAPHEGGGGGEVGRGRGRRSPVFLLEVGKSGLVG